MSLPALPVTAARRRPVDLLMVSIVQFAPPAALVLGVWLWATGRLVPGWPEFLCWWSMQALSILGIELGYHRLYSHRAFRARPGVRWVLLALGSLAFQGPLIWWASIHRKHHRYTDRAGDPYSMYVHGQDGAFTVRGAVHAHFGWMWSYECIGRGGFSEFAVDMYRDRIAFWMHMHYMYFAAATFAIPALVGWLAYGTWAGAASVLLWGGFVRIFCANHLTFWGINSVLHGVGRRPYATPDHSTNFAPLSLFTWGQGLHNNHHAYPSAADMRHRPGEFDPGMWVVEWLERLGWVDEVVRPPADLAARFSHRAPGG